MTSISNAKNNVCDRTHGRGINLAMGLNDGVGAGSSRHAPTAVVQHHDETPLPVGLVTTAPGGSGLFSGMQYGTPFRLTMMPSPSVLFFSG